MDDVHKQEFHVRSLPTRSVTLFPTRAQVVREIKDVTLKPGANEIIVVGVTPTADEHTIKVEGTGSAIITDITVELLPNRDIFEDIYPESDSESDRDESESESDDEDKVNAALEDVRAQLVTLGDEQKRAKETVASAESRLKILDAFGNALDRKRGVNIEANLETYRAEREKVFRDHMDGITRDRAIAKDITKLRREETRLRKLQTKEEERAAKEKAKVKRAKDKLRDKQRRRDEERKKEKARIHKEREHFWPRSCYTVRISLDAAGPILTPTSSRRSSIASAADVHLVTEKGASPKDADSAAASTTCDLTLSYVTSSAFWSPSYDLALSSTTNTATLCFDARLTNMTSETWANSKVTLSTSQANFSGLQDDTPTLVPWRLKLAGRGGPAWDGFDIVHSREERAEKEIWNAAQNALGQQKARAGLFGSSQAPQQQKNFAFSKSAAPNSFPAPQAPMLQVQAQQQAQSFGSAPAPQAAAWTSNVVGGGGGVGFGAANAAPVVALGAARGGLFGAVTNAATSSLSKSSKAAARTGDLRRSSASPSSGSTDNLYGGAAYDEADEADARTMLDAAPEVTFQDSSFEETGLTATYDLPHLKTLKPSSTASKQRVARVSFANITFSRTVVAKYKPAAYLRARLRNASKLTLLRGPTGLTLDGTFLGRSTLPRCSAGDVFSIPLGVDPAIRVAYPKPDVSRSTTGVFTKGENCVYTRAVTLVNTRAGAGKPVAVTVLDQVPVSEDEKLRVDLLQPSGMQSGARAVAAGVPGRDGKEEADWGRATASMRKAGEVQWEVVLNAGRSAKLVLQYEVAFPTGERVAQVY
ncbi:hypothetical protein C8A05DRAFT_33147 [Staphylotrichum tortipilum]|uniref:Mucoidy inhibitor-like protein n=1 Tax=Staphylotrichum tortipilum TaxID=2831512 RepID=A0AAN6RUD6_9PEZI|nr:hypothetical protein C8A05DRAFT_33147 [Staphylotrichum longicolle]